uniref:CCHC-type domain-containing protein n=1 Tax=Aegilops tauschii subsp. strangulata TaxID=200361 RepID=A0A453RW19_AEGTS
DLVEHVNAFNQLVMDLARLDVKIEDEDKALLLVSLPPSYEHLVITLTHGKTTVNNEEVTAALLGHELRKQKNATDESTQDLGLAVKGYQLRKGEEAEKKKKKKVQCYRCKDWGHIKRECPELKGGASANAATRGDDSDSSSDVLVVSNRRSTKAEAWMLDSACSFHATPNREWFSSYKSGEFGLAYVGDDTGYRVAGVGDIKIKMFDGVERMLRGVRHVPGLKRNLISLGVLHDGGMEFRCDRDTKIMEIMEDGVTVMIGERTASHLYKL